MSFALHPDFASAHVVGDLKHCRVLLLDNANFPWLVLVPRYENMRELFDLPPAAYHEVMDEVRTTGERLLAHTKADKINIAALGNVTPQLHIHVIARFKTDSAWPNPVWNSTLPARSYSVEEISAALAMAHQVTNL